MTELLCAQSVADAGRLEHLREQFGVKTIERIVENNSTQSAYAVIQTLQAELEAFTAGAYMQTERSIIVIKRC